MESGSRTSGKNSNAPYKGRKQLGKQDKEIVSNVYDYLRQAMSQAEALSRCESMTGVSSSTVYRIIKEKQNTGSIQAARTYLRGRKPIEIDEYDKTAIRRTVHSFYFNNEIPTLESVFIKIQGDETIPQMSRETFRKLLLKLDFRFVKHNRKSALIEKPEIVTWRRSYLRSIAELRKQNRKIYYVGKSWVNAGCTIGKVTSEGLSTDSQAPVDKGLRLIVMHVGSDDGFLEDSSLIFLSKKTAEYDDDMNAERFEQWFESVLNRVPEKSVIILDSAQYHSRRSEHIPTAGSRKIEMQQWLREKGIAFDDGAVKPELMSLIKQHRSKYTQYVVDDMARRRGIIVLRLPPYHCELNPIQLIWVEVKGYIGRHNVTFEIVDVEHLLHIALEGVTPLAWQIAINHILKEEERMWQLDFSIDNIVDPLMSNIGADDSSDSDSSISLPEADT
ncbi:hypothetical protein NQ318_000701 [Aromia moschata]|uniref:Tc1-like transposase DDE domain-containing protein n=1 Tax=Aromia moschata TaxID=1265417 RepID=A0AAV8X1F7_9CUCU|nr:hypothetical protein NQ318_000701 [Aromia moschata]